MTTPDFFGYNREPDLQARLFAPGEPSLLEEFFKREWDALRGSGLILDYTLHAEIRILGIELVNRKTGEVVRDAYGNTPTPKDA